MTAVIALYIGQISVCISIICTDSTLARSAVC